MSSAEEARAASPLRTGDEEKKSAGSVDDDAKPDEAKGGTGSYFVSTQSYSGYNQLIS